jgi:chemotaxis protein MotA
MSEPRRRLEFGSVIGVPAAIAIVLLAQVLEGASAWSLWQPTAALVVFGGTAAAIFVSFPADLVFRTASALYEVFVAELEPPGAMLDHIMAYAQISRRHGLLALEPEIDEVRDPFLRGALTLAVDGTNQKTVRQILETESRARLEREEAPADVLETAAGYTPTLGILGAVLGLIHVMGSLTEPSKLGSGIAVAFVATVYGVGSANLLLLPLATKLRGRARKGALNREVIIEGIVALQEGLNPWLIEQKLRGLLGLARRPDTKKRVA